MDAETKKLLLDYLQSLQVEYERQRDRVGYHNSNNPERDWEGHNGSVIAVKRIMNDIIYRMKSPSERG